MSQYKAKSIKPKVIDKTPDEFVTTMDHVTRFAKANQTTIFGVLIILLVTGLVYFGMNYIQNKNILEVNQKIYEASLIEDDQERLKSYQGIISDYSDSSVVSYLKLNLIENDLSQDDLESALTKIDELESLNHTALNGGLILSKINILWEQDQHDKAVALIEQHLSEKDTQLNLYGKYLKGLILEDQGQNEDALKVFRDLLANKDLSINLKNQIKSRLVWISIN